MSAPTITPTSDRPSGVQLVTPNDWWQLPLDPKTRHQAIAQLVDERVPNEPHLLPLRGELIAKLRRTARRSADAGAIFCASLTAVEADEALAANVLVLLTPVTTVDGTGASHDVDAFASTLAATIDDLVPGTTPVIDTVELPAGRAARLRARRLTNLDELGRDAEVLSVQLFVPVPGSDLTAIVTFTSPSLGYEAELVDLFEAMAGTFTFLDATGEPWRHAAAPDARPAG